jgi:hypothetical protein
MGGPFGLANATDSKKKPTLIGRLSLQVATNFDRRVKPRRSLAQTLSEYLSTKLGVRGPFRTR